MSQDVTIISDHEGIPVYTQLEKKKQEKKIISSHLQK